MLKRLRPIARSIVSRTARARPQSRGLDVDGFFGRIYCLTLHRTPGKTKALERRLGRVGISNFEIIYGIDRKALDAERLLAEGAVVRRKRLSNGEIACALGHRMIWEYALNRAQAPALILEDDADFEPEFKKRIAEVLAQLAVVTDWDLCYFGRGGLPYRDAAYVEGAVLPVTEATATIVTPDQYVSRNIIRPAPSNSTYAYALSRTGLEKLPGLTALIDKPADINFAYLQHSGKLNVVAVHPSLIYHHSPRTEIKGHRSFVQNRARTIRDPLYSAGDIRSAEDAARSNLAILGRFLERAGIDRHASAKTGEGRYRVTLDEGLRPRVRVALEAMKGEAPIHIRFQVRDNEYGTWNPLQYLPGAVIGEELTACMALEVGERYVADSGRLLFGSRLACQLCFSESTVEPEPASARGLDGVATDAATADHEDAVDLVLFAAGSGDAAWAALALRYALRSIAMHAAFIRNVYLVTEVDPPDWLDFTGDRLKLVRPPAVEANRVAPQSSPFPARQLKALSDNYLVLWADTFLGAPVFAQDCFYTNGIARVSLREIPDPVARGGLVADPALHPQNRSLVSTLLEENPNLDAAELVGAAYPRYAFTAGRAVFGELRHLDVPATEQRELSRLLAYSENRRPHTFRFRFSSPGAPRSDSLAAVADTLRNYLPIRSPFEAEAPCA